MTGYFFPINDAMRDKSLRTEELYPRGRHRLCRDTRPGASLDRRCARDARCSTPAGEAVADASGVG